MAPEKRRSARLPWRIGRVSISVIPVPFPHQTKPEPAAGMALASNLLPKGATSVSTRFMGRTGLGLM
jgi:hypothetical protein